MSTETTIADKLEDLIEAKADMKSAIESKGVTITGGLSTYANAIDKIKIITDDDFVSFPDGTKFMYSNCESLPDSMIKYLENTTDWYEIFRGSNLTNLPLIDASHVINASRAFLSCNLVSVAGLKNLGANKDCRVASIFQKNFYLSKQSILNIINNLYDRASAGYSGLTISFPPDVYDRLITDDEIIMASNKGWIIERNVYYD